MKIEVIIKKFRLITSWLDALNEPRRKKKQIASK